MAADSYRRDRDEEEDADEELDENDYKSQKDAVLFIIDVSKSMLEPPPKSESKKADKDSPIAAALKSAYQIMQQRIISSPKDLMGIIFFGTKETKFRVEEGGGTPYPHCYLFVDLDVPAAEDVKVLKELVEEGQDPEGVLTPADEPVNMANVLFAANQIFTTNAPNFGSRRLFIITDNDDPHSGNRTARSSAAVRAKDLYDLGVIIELFPISKGEEKFDLAKFYEDIIYRNPAEEAGLSDSVKSSKSGDGLTLLNSLISNINSKQTPKRAYFSHLPFEIAPGLTISVKGYIPLHSQKPARSCYIYLDDEKPKFATGEQTKLDVESARTVEKEELKKAYKFGGEYVYFTPEESKKLKDWGGHVLRIIGFKPRSALPSWASVKKSVFIFPSEEDYVGSTRVFSALWKKLLQDEKIALAWFVARVNANPVLVAIIPSKPQHDEDSGTNFLPAGLWLYTLPFADDIREVGERKTAEAPEEVVGKMRKVVQNLMLPKNMYNPSKYPNPSLQWHYKILQTLALEEEVPEPGPDATMPKYKAIANRVGEALEEVNGDIEVAARLAAGSRAVKRDADDDEDGESARPTKKSRTTAAGTSSSSGKRGAGTGGGMSNAQLKAAAEKQTLGKMTVAELKDILTSKGISTAGKKADLVERLEDWVDSNT